MTQDFPASGKAPPPAAHAGDAQAGTVQDSPLQAGAVQPDVAAGRPAPAGGLARIAGRVGRRLLQPGLLLNNLRALAREVRAGGLAGAGAYLRRKIAGAVDSSVPNGLYRVWVQRFDTLTDADRQVIRDAIARMPDPPLISVVVPVYNTPEAVLRAMIASVENQLYDRWELCIADDASTLPHVAPLLRECAARDGRIKVATRPVNGHICAATNTALGLAGGAYVAFLDHDDLLAENALYEVAAAIGAHPEAALFFSDEDKIDSAGRRSTPYFKPRFSRDLLLGQNVVNHLSVYRRALVEELGGLREGFEGSQDYDLALRAVDAVGAGRVRHIPAVLYHWRQDERSNTFSQAQLDRCLDSARRAIQESLDRARVLGRDGGRRAVVEPNPLAPGWNRVRWALPEPAPLVSVIIPTRDRADLLETCITGLLERTAYRNIEILIVDNGSVEPATHELLDRYRRDARFRVLTIGGAFNYSALNNAAAAEARGEVLLLLNNDIDVIGPDWLSEMVSLATRDGIGVVGAKLLYADGRIQHAGVALGAGTFEDGPGVAGHIGLLRARADPGYFGQYALTRDVAAVTGACLAIRKAVFDEVGGLDAVNLKVAFNDVDLCLRVREAGYRVLWTPFAELFHLESVSRGADTDGEKRRRFEGEVRWMKARWGDALQPEDPRREYFNLI